MRPSVRPHGGRRVILDNDVAFTAEHVRPYKSTFDLDREDLPFISRGANSGARCSTGARKRAQTLWPVGKWVDTDNCLIVPRRFHVCVSTKMKRPNLRIGPCCLNDPTILFYYTSVASRDKNARST